MAEAAAAKEQAQYDILIAEKGNGRRQLEAEEDRRREQQRAQHDRDLAVLAANKTAAMADAKLNAIEQVIQEEERTPVLLENSHDFIDSKSRTKTWVHSLKQLQLNAQIHRTRDFDPNPTVFSDSQ